MKASWAVLNTTIGKNPEKVCNYTKLNIDGANVTDKQTIAEYFNNYFTHIGKNLADTLPELETTPQDYLSGDYPNNMFIEPVIPEEVLKLIKSLKTKTSCGHDEISSKLLKTVADEITVPLAHILNISFSTGEIPEDMKIAKVIPIFKSGDKCSLNNYRPISLLSVFSKIM